MDPAALVPGVIEAIEDAGQRALKRLNRPKDIAVKGSKADVVTDVDTELQLMIATALHRLLPSSRLLVEEDISTLPPEIRATVISMDELSTIPNDVGVWIVDPIDGTTNYSHSLPFFSHSIGLWYGGNVVLGVVHSPATSETYHAVKGRGSYLNGRAISASKTADISLALGVTGYPYDQSLGQAQRHLIDLFSRELQELRIMGSSALELCYVGAGKFDVYWEPGLKIWDTAAGQLIAREAGAVVSDFIGRVFSPTKPHIVATNPPLHPKVMEIIKREWQA